MLEVLNFSAVYWESMSVDGFHYDLEPWGVWNDESRKHLGELMAQAAQHTVARLCTV